jgi:hypothetical protein
MSTENKTATELENMISDYSNKTLPELECIRDCALELLKQSNSYTPISEYQRFLDIIVKTTRLIEFIKEDKKPPTP